MMDILNSKSALKYFSIFIFSGLIFTHKGCAKEGENQDGSFDVIKDTPSDEYILDTIDGETMDLQDSECIPVQEQCNGKDDDCDGRIDNGIDILSDSNNCGACGWVCNLPNATSTCINAACWVLQCNDGFIDLDKDPTNGCEYECIPERPNESRDDGTCEDGVDNDCDGRVDNTDGDCSSCIPEYCDTIDNDCDGLVDEDFNLRTDPNHCGSCGTVCPDYPRAKGTCIMGICTITCDPGYANLDGIILNGCEEICVPSTDQNESTCNGKDDDCDGFIDEDYTPYFCGAGACAQASVCLEGNESCTEGQPGSTSDTVCNNIDDDCDGSVDEDYQPSDKCVGYCKQTAVCRDGNEICGSPLPNDTSCNGIDDDCNGLIDDGYIPYFCGEGACRRQSTCIGGRENCDPGPQSTEICNGSDDDCDGNIDNGNISTLCPTPPPHGVADCQGGVCVIGTCDSGWYDLDNLYINGCECQVESNELTGNNSCSSSIDIGTLSDTGTSVNITGNIVPSSDVDWYKFTANDTSDTTCDTYHVKVRFLSNPGNVFRFDIYRGSCTSTAICLNEIESFEWYTDFRSGSGISALGECPCRPSPPGSGYNECQNDTAVYYIRIYRISGSSCDSYTLQVSNAL